MYNVLHTSSLVLRRIQSRSFGCNHLVLRTWTASSTVFGLSATALLANSTMVNTAATVAFIFLGNGNSLISELAIVGVKSRLHLLRPKKAITLIEAEKGEAKAQG